MSKSHKQRVKIKTLVNNNFNTDYIRVDIDSYISYPSLETTLNFAGSSLTQLRLDYLLENNKVYFDSIIKKILAPIARIFNHYDFKVSISLLYEYYNLNVGHGHAPVIYKKTNKKAYLDFKLYFANSNHFVYLGILNDDIDYKRLFELEYESDNDIAPLFIKNMNINSYKLKFDVDQKSFYYKNKKFKNLVCTQHSFLMHNLIKNLKNKNLISSKDFFKISYIYENNTIRFYLLHHKHESNKVEISNLYHILNDEKQLLTVFRDKNFVFTSDWFTDEIKSLSLSDIIMLASVLKY